METLAEICDAGIDANRAVALRRQAVSIADLAYPATDARRGFVRINAAQVLARQGQFEEAERLVNEAITLSRQMRPPQPAMFELQLQEIQNMKAAAAAAAAAQAKGTAASKWFNRTGFLVAPIQK